MEREFSEFREIDTSLEHEWGHFKDPVSHMCLAGAVVASWSLTLEVAGLNPFIVMTNILVTEFSEFKESFRKNNATETVQWRTTEDHRGKVLRVLMHQPFLSMSSSNSKNIENVIVDKLSAYSQDFSHLEGGGANPKLGTNL